MLAFALSNGYTSKWPMAPIRLLARRSGVYKHPIIAYGLDFRFEDNKFCDLRKAIGLDSAWIAHHPIDPYYLIGMNGTVEATHATWHFIRTLQKNGQLPRDLYRLPDKGDAAWWEWVVAFNTYGLIIKAPKIPRSTDPTPDDIDEHIEISSANYEQILDGVDVLESGLISESIKTRAYYLWREAGSPIMSGYGFWLQAVDEYDMV